jgi:hypothetical protein
MTALMFAMLLSLLPLLNDLMQSLDKCSLSRTEVGEPVDPQDI